MAVVRWVFEDPVLLETEVFDVNPSAGGSPGYEKNFLFQETTAPDGKTLIFEGQDAPQNLAFSGTILDQAQYEMFREWFSKRYQIKVTDDLGRQFMILIKSFKPERVRARSHPWKHTYTVEAAILDWPV